MTICQPSLNTVATKAVIACSNFGKGATRPAIKKSIATVNEKEVDAPALRRALKKLVADGALSQDGQRFKVTVAGKASVAPKKAKKVVKKKAATKKKKTTKKKAAPKKKATTKKKAAPKKKTSTKKKAAPKKKAATKKKAAPKKK